MSKTTVSDLGSINGVTVSVDLTGSDLLVLAAHVKCNTETTIASIRAANQAAAAELAGIDAMIDTLADGADDLLAKLHASYELGVAALWAARGARDTRTAAQRAPMTVDRG